MTRRWNEVRKNRASVLERRRVVGPLNDPLIEAYERLHARLTKEQEESKDLYQKMALSQATRALVNAIENERLIYGPYEKVRMIAPKS
jgi:hypothetical protein